MTRGSGEVDNLGSVVADRAHAVDAVTQLTVAHDESSAASGFSAFQLDGRSALHD